MALDQPPDIGKLAARLARDNAKVEKFADSLPSRAAQIAEAIRREDWMEVRRLSEYLVRSGQTYGLPELHRCAQAVCDDMNEPARRAGIGASLQRLLSMCRQSRRSAPGAPHGVTNSAKAT